jgi:hypothetical protein
MARVNAAKGGAFKENFTYTAKDIRFTTKGKTLYAIALGWPDDGESVIKSLAKTGRRRRQPNQARRVARHKGKLKFTQTTEGLIVELPAKNQRPDLLAENHREPFAAGDAALKKTEAPQPRA